MLAAALLSVAAKAITRYDLDPASGDPGRDATSGALLTPSAGIVGLVGMLLVGTTAWSAAPTIAHGRDGIESWGGHHVVLPVGARQRQAEWLAAIRGFRPVATARFML